MKCIVPLYLAVSLLVARLVLLDGCCDMLSNSPDILVKCLNDSITTSMNTCMTSEVDGTIGPTLSVEIVTRVTPSIYDYAAYSLSIQWMYAQANGYNMLPLYPDSNERDFRFHRKLTLLLDAITSYTLLPDYIAWFDADLIPLDFSLRIEKIAAGHPQAHILMSEDVSSVANTGFIIVRPTRWVQRFIRAWLNMRLETGIETDQLGFDALSSVWDAVDWQTRIAILPAHVMNSIAAPMGEQLPHHKVLHLAAESSALRAFVFRAAAVEVCGATSQHRAIQHQLGVTRGFLQRAAVEVYGPAYRMMERKILHEIMTSGNEVVKPENIVDELSAYRTAVSKYAFALTYMNNHLETQKTLNLRVIANIVAHSLTLHQLSTLFLESTRVLSLAGMGHTSTDRLVIILSAELRSFQENLKNVNTEMQTELSVFISSMTPNLKSLRDCLSTNLHHVIRIIQLSARQDTLLRETYVNLPEILKLSSEINHELLVITYQIQVIICQNNRLQIYNEFGRELQTELTGSLRFYITCLRLFTQSSQIRLIEQMANDVEGLVGQIEKASECFIKY